MIEGLKPYPAYKGSSAPWLGEVPEHWEVQRLKYLLKERDVRSSDGNEQLLRVSQFTGVTERKRADGGDEPDTRAESLVGYKRVATNDLVINIMLAWNGSMGVSSFVGIASPAYCVYQFGPKAQPWYFHHLLRSPTYKARIKAESTGVVESRLRLYTDDLYRLEGLLPPLHEQTAIVRFLDYADRRIRRYIRAKQKLIRLLEEQKQAIIHRAVTRGLDPNVHLKPSGVEWLGDVPEHWALMALKHACVLLRDGTHLPPPRQVDGFPLLSVRNIVSGRLVRREDDSFISMAHFKELCRPFTPRQGDVLLAIVGATLGKVAIVPKMDPFQIQRSLAVLRSQEDLLDSRFLAAFLEGPAFQRALWTTVAFSAQPGIYLSTLGAFRIPVPTIAEQLAIIERLEDSTAAVTRGIERTHREISLLREYRTRLIADVVTGKLDVRETAARFPDEAETPEPPGEADALSDADEDTADDLDAVPEAAEEIGEVAQ